jgi:hypothetical protein
MEIYNPNIKYIGAQEITDSNTHIIYITPEQFKGSDTSRINQAINYASSNNFTIVMCNGEYFLDSAIIMKSNVTLINNGLIQMNSGMRDNIVRASSNVVGAPITNIKIKGAGIFRGSSDSWGGGDATGVNGEYWRPIAILLANATNFELEGFTIKNSHMWGINMEQSRFGSVKNIKFDNDGSKPNQDGVNVRHGSHNIIIENISGSTNDDIVALTNLGGYPGYNFLGDVLYETGKTNFDIFDIVIRNINAIRPPMKVFSGITPTHYSGGILLLCEDGLKIFNVSIDGVNGYSQIALGFTAIAYWTTSQATVNDMYNISVSNTGQCPVYPARPIKDSTLINIPTTEINGIYPSGIFQNGSLNVFRKYHDSIPEYFTNITGLGDYHLVVKQDLLPNIDIVPTGNFTVPNGTKIRMITLTSASPQDVILPAIADAIGSIFFITNDSLSTVNIKSKTGTNDIWDSMVVTNDKTVDSGTTQRIINDGVNYKIL